MPRCMLPATWASRGPGKAQGTWRASAAAASCSHATLRCARAHSDYCYNLPPCPGLYLTTPCFNSPHNPRVCVAQAYELRGAGAVIHSHSMNAFMATILDPEASEFTVTHIEMIKAGGHWGAWGATDKMNASWRRHRGGPEVKAGGQGGAWATWAGHCALKWQVMNVQAQEPGEGLAGVVPMDTAAQRHSPQGHSWSVGGGQQAVSCAGSSGGPPGTLPTHHAQTQATSQRTAPHILHTSHVRHSHWHPVCRALRATASTATA